MSNRKRKHARASAPTVCVALCCNDPDNGLFWERACGIIIQAGGQSIDLDGGDVRMTITEAGIRIFRRVFPFSACQDWVGNWCWNEYWMRIDDAARLLWCALRAGFTSTGASGDEACELSDLCDEFPEWNEWALRDQMLKMVVA